MESQDDLIKQGSKAPFVAEREGLKLEDDIHPNLTEIGNQVIRRHDIDHLQKLFDSKDRHEAVKNLEKALTDLDVVYGIHIPSVDFVIGREDGDRHYLDTDKIYLFSLISKIDGLPLTTDGSSWVGHLPPLEFMKLKQEFVALVDSLLFYIEDNINNESETILYDISKIRNFVWGIEPKDPIEKHLYFVDIGTDEALRKTKESIVNYRHLFLDGLASTMNVYGKKFGIDFKKEQDRLLRLYSKCS